MMAGAWICSVFVFCILHLNNVEFTSCLKLNVPRVLLPFFENENINFTLEFTTPGCYKWSTSRPDVARLYLIDEDHTHHCASAAVVSAVYRHANRATAIVFTEDMPSGEMVRCDVIVDSIHSLEVVTTTRELYIEEAPEEFEVRAYDDQGNEFTSLEGIPFRWVVESVSDSGTESDPSDILRFIRFQDTPYKTPLAIDALERRGLQGHKVLLEGLKTGSAKVSVKLTVPQYKMVETVEVRLSVVANLILDPAEVYLLPGAIIHFRLLQVHQGRLQEIPLPSTQYHIEIVDPNIAALETKTSNITANRIGDTTVVLRDQNMQEEGMKAIYSTIHVRDADHISIVAMPHRNWVLMVGQVYEVSVEVFDKQNNLFYPSDNIKVSAVIPEEYFYTNFKSNNGTYHVVKPKKQGDVTLHATLKYMIKNGYFSSDANVAEATALAHIYLEIEVAPQLTILPWDPVNRPRYDVKLSVSGGSGSFIWSSTNTSVAIVNQKGMGKTNELGYTTLVAAMAQNEHNRGSAKVYVLPALNMEILSAALESEINVPILISLAFYTMRPDDLPRTKIPFTECRDIPFQVAMDEEKNFEWDKKTEYEHTSPACTIVPIIGKAVGHTKVTITYNIEYPDSVTCKQETLRMKKSIMVSTFRPLRLVHPSCGETVLAVGSSRSLVFEGGPRPWVGRPSAFYRKIFVSNETTAEVKEVKITKQFQDVFVYRALCMEEGETEVTLRVGNTPCPDNENPIYREASVKVFCAIPKWIFLKPEISKPEGTHLPCPMDSESGRIPIQNYRSFEVTVEVKDELGRVFDNISSLHIDWSVSENSLLKIQKANSVFPEDKLENGYILSGRTYQIMDPQAIQGTVEVTATIVGYQNAMLSKSKIKMQPKFPSPGEPGEVSYPLDLELVGDAYLLPTRIAIFNHPVNKRTLQVLQGSGFYEFEPLHPGIVDLHYIMKNRTLLLTPKTDGTQKLTVRDLCLTSRSVATAEIQVSGVHRIDVTMPDKVEVGKYILARIRVFDSLGNSIPSSTYSLMGLQPDVTSNIISVKPSDVSKLKDDEVVYLVQGDILGDTTLTFTAGHKGREIRSVPQPIQVFPKLQLSPKNVTLFVGSVLQLLSRGGPQPDASVEFSVDDIDVVTVNVGGVLEGEMVGRTRVEGRVVGLDSSTRQPVVYSMDWVNVNVINITNLRIDAPLTRMKTGTTMPLMAVGIDEAQNPFLFAGNMPLVQFEWSVSSKEIATVVNVYHKSGIESLLPDRVTVRLIARRPGHATVKLISKILNTVASKLVFDNELEIEVFEELRLVSGSGNCHNVLMTPSTDMQLKTNRDGTARVTYEILGKTPNSKPVVTVDSTGLVTSSDSIGKAVVMINVKEDFGVVQTLSITFDIKPVSYIMINVNTFMSSTKGEKLVVLPRGVKVPITITYHDNVGMVFSATNTQIKFRPNRYDLIQLSPGQNNNTLVAQTLQVGRTVLRVWDVNNERNDDYILFAVGDGIVPSIRNTTLTVGDMICFHSGITGTDGRTGRWSTDPSGVVDIDGDTGVALAVSNGFTNVVYNVGDVATSMEVNILPVSKITFVLPEENILINGMYSQVNKLPFYLSNSANNNETERNICTTCSPQSFKFIYSFTCEMSFVGAGSQQVIAVTDVFRISPGFNTDTGLYHCEVAPISTPSKDYTFLQGNVQVWVRVAPINGQEEIISDTLQLQFIPGFTLHTSELHLNNYQAEGFIAVSGIPKVLFHTHAHPSDNAILDCTGVDRITENTIQFTVKLLAGYWNAMDSTTKPYVKIESLLTKQIVRVPVFVKLVSKPGRADQFGKFDSTWSGLIMSIVTQYYIVTWAFFTVLIAVAATYVAQRVWYIPGYYASQQQGVFVNTPPNRPPQQIAGSVSPQSRQNELARRLWSTGDRQQYYGTPTLNRSPPYRGSPYT